MENNEIYAYVYSKEGLKKLIGVTSAIILLRKMKYKMGFGSLMGFISCIFMMALVIFLDLPVAMENVISTFGIGAFFGLYAVFGLFYLELSSKYNNLIKDLTNTLSKERGYKEIK